MSKCKYTREHKGNSLIDFPLEYTVIDLETTGLDPEYNDIIEISAIKYKNCEEIDRFTSLVQPPYECLYDGGRAVDITFCDEQILYKEKHEI